MNVLLSEKSDANRSILVPLDKIEANPYAVRLNQNVKARRRAC